MEQHGSERDETPFAQVPERNPADVMLRTTQQHHVALSTMADTKANIIITVSSIVLTLSMGRLDQPELRASVLTLTVFTLLALLLAILAVLPKFRGKFKFTGPLPPDFNILFFGHFSALDRERFMQEMAQRMMPGVAYETVVRDVYSLGSYLSQHKYPYLRWSYLFFLAGFVMACVVQGAHLIFG
jgi:hypothetical protein